MLRPKEHNFRGKLWKIKWARPRRKKSEIEKGLSPVGLCSPNISTITISPYETSWDLVDTMIHEGFHACVYDLDEPCVTETARDITKFLKATGMKISFE